MTAATWAAAIGGAGLLFTLMVTGLGMLVKITRSWGKVEARLDRLVDKVTDLVTRQQEDGDRTGKAMERLDDRLTRHEAWHDDHPWSGHTARS